MDGRVSGFVHHCGYPDVRVAELGDYDRGVVGEVVLVLEPVFVAGEVAFYLEHIAKTPPHLIRHPRSTRIPFSEYRNGLGKFTRSNAIVGSFASILSERNARRPIVIDVTKYGRYG